jgi:tetratricopeptide (TPR) repeat protein
MKQFGLILSVLLVALHGNGAIVLNQINNEEDSILVANSFETGLDKYHTKDYEGAISDFNKVIGTESTHFEAYLYRGLSSYYSSDYINALSEYDMAISLDSKKTDPYFYRGLLYVKIENWKQGNKDLKRAIKGYNKQLKEDKLNVSAQLKRASAKFITGNLFAAEDDYSYIVELHPNNVRAYFYRGRVRLELRNYNGAVADFEKVLELDSLNGDAMFQLAEVKEKQGDMESAAEYYSRIGKVFPGYETRYILQGEHELDQKQYSNALKSFEIALKINANNFEVYKKRGQVQFQKKNYRDAVKDYSEYLDHFPNDPEVNYLNGLAKMKLGDRTGACEDFHTAESFGNEDASKAAKKFCN